MPLKCEKPEGYTVDPAELAAQLEKALFDYERGDDYAEFHALTLFEGEWRIVLDALKFYATNKDQTPTGEAK